MVRHRPEFAPRKEVFVYTERGFPIGEDSYISDFVRITRPHLVSVGSHTNIDFGFYCTTALEVGDYCHIAPYTVVIGGARGQLKLGHFCHIGGGSHMICGSDSLLGLGLVGPTIPEPYKDRLTIEPITFKNFSGTGQHVVIVPGVTLAEGSIVGACSLLMEDTEPWTIYYGVPAKPKKRRSEHIMKQYAKELGYENIF